MLTKNSLKILSKHFAAASSDSGGGKDGDGGAAAAAAALAGGEDGRGATSRIVFVLTAFLSIPEIEVQIYSLYVLDIQYVGI